MNWQDNRNDTKKRTKLHAYKQRKKMNYIYVGIHRYTHTLLSSCSPTRKTPSRSHVSIFLISKVVAFHSPFFSVIRFLHYHSIYFLFCRVADSQSKPSYRPSPVVAQQACMYHCLWRRPCKPSLSVISAALMAFGKSCLLANTNRIDSRNSSSFNMRCNSSLAKKK